jgi:hypothetical protein
VCPGSKLSGKEETCFAVIQEGGETYTFMSYAVHFGLDA